MKATIWRAVLLTALLGLGLSAARLGAADEEDKLRSPSPDGRFAFVDTESDNAEAAIDLVDARTAKRLRRVGAEGHRSFSALWSPDSKRFALMERYGHPFQAVFVYVRRGEKFVEIKLPELTAEIPERLKRGHTFPHVANENWQSASRWRKDGSLEVEISTMIDGAGWTITAERRVVLGEFEGKSGKAKVLKSSTEFQSEKE